MSELARTCTGQKISYQVAQFFDDFENCSYCVFPFHGSIVLNLFLMYFSAAVIVVGSSVSYNGYTT